MTKNRLYIAYGSNLNLPQMAFRCPTAKVVGTSEVKGYELLFRGGSRGAVATIEPLEGSSVPVLLWKIRPQDEIALDRYEGYPEMHEGLVNAVGEGTVLARPLDLNSMEYPLLIIDESAGDLVEGLVNICAVQPESEELVRRGWWKVTTITQIPDTASQ